MNPAIQAFLIKLAIKLALRLHKGPMHDLAERYRKELAELEAKNEIKK